jgi:hypothetical protein
MPAAYAESAAIEFDPAGQIGNIAQEEGLP